MNFDRQITHKPDGIRHGKLSHRPLREAVYQSAVEVAKRDILLVDEASRAHPLEHLADFGLVQRFEDKATRFILRKPLKASLLAAGSGAVLALLLEQGLKRLFRVVR